MNFIFVFIHYRLVLRLTISISTPYTESDLQNITAKLQIFPPHINYMKT